MTPLGCKFAAPFPMTEMLTFYSNATKTMQSYAVSAAYQSNCTVSAMIQLIYNELICNLFIFITV